MKTARACIRLLLCSIVIALSACGGGGGGGGGAGIPTGTGGCTWDSSNWNQCNWR